MRTCRLIVPSRLLKSQHRSGDLILANDNLTLFVGSYPAVQIVRSRVVEHVTNMSGIFAGRMEGIPATVGHDGKNDGHYEQRHHQNDNPVAESLQQSARRRHGLGVTEGAAPKRHGSEKQKSCDASRTSPKQLRNFAQTSHDGGPVVKLFGASRSMR